MSYIDGFVNAVPTANKQQSIDHAKTADAMFLEMGAMRIIECWGDDVKAGKQTDFRRAVDATDDETLFSPGSNGPTERPEMRPWPRWTR